MNPADKATEKAEALKGLLARAKDLIARKASLLSDYRKKREAAKIEEIKKDLQS